MSLPNSLTYKTDTDLLMIDNHVAELHHPGVLLTNILVEATIRPVLSNFVVSSSNQILLS